jgi:hypothetical protein
MFLASLLLFTPSPDLGTLKVRNMYSVHLDRWSFRWCRWLDSTISCTEYLQKRQIPEQKWICSKILSDNTPGMSEFLWISIFKIQKEISWHSWLDLHYVTPVHPTVQCGWLKCLSRAFFGTTIVLKITSRNSFELCSNNYQLECWFCVEQFTNFGSVNIMFNTIHTDGNPKKILASWNLFQWLDLSSIFSHNQLSLNISGFQNPSLCSSSLNTQQLFGWKNHTIHLCMIHSKWGSGHHVGLGVRKIQPLFSNIVLEQFPLHNQERCKSSNHITCSHAYFLYTTKKRDW